MRTYLIFGSGDEGVKWEPLGIVNADSHEQAREKAADEKPGFAIYGSCPFRNWRSGRPNERMVRDWDDFDIKSIPGQMTVDEVLDEIAEEEEDDLLRHAEEVVETVRERVDEEE